MSRHLGTGACAMRFIRDIGLQHWVWRAPSRPHRVPIQIRAVRSSFHCHSSTLPSPFTATRGPARPQEGPREPHGDHPPRSTSGPPHPPPSARSDPRSTGCDPRCAPLARQPPRSKILSWPSGIPSQPSALIPPRVPGAGATFDRTVDPLRSSAPPWRLNRAPGRPPSPSRPSSSPPTLLSCDAEEPYAFPLCCQRHLASRP